MAMVSPKTALLALCDLIWYLTFKSTIFQLWRDGSSWVQPGLTQRIKCLAQGHNAVAPVRLGPATHRSRVKHSTTEQLCSFVTGVVAGLAAACLLPFMRWYKHEYYYKCNVITLNASERMPIYAHATSSRIENPHRDDHVRLTPHRGLDCIWTKAQIVADRVTRNQPIMTISHPSATNHIRTYRLASLRIQA